MNILHTLTAYPPSTGGAQLHHHQLIKTLIKHHNVQILTYWDQNRTDWLLGTTLKANNNSTSYVFEGVNINKIGFLWDEKIKMLPYLLGYYSFMHWYNNIIYFFSTTGYNRFYSSRNPQTSIFFT